jgi:hypothetical protein
MWWVVVREIAKGQGTMKQLAKKLLDWKTQTGIQSSLSTAKEYSDVKALGFLAEAVQQFAASRKFSPIQIFNLFYEINRKLYPDLSSTIVVV